MALALILSLTACLAWRVTLTASPGPLNPAPNTIALAPADGIFTDLIGVELAEHGYAIVDTDMTQSLLIVLRERKENVLAPQVMTAFRRRGIDAILTVHHVDSPHHLPQKATAQLYGTLDITVVCRVEWHTGWRQRGPVVAAQEIAGTLTMCLNRPSYGQ
jgi:hypothetical protein